jgi:hypothetical protein
LANLRFVFLFQTPLASKCSARNPKKTSKTRCFQTIHQIGAVMRSGECLP